jgi:hypothetical protein
MSPSTLPAKRWSAKTKTKRHARPSRSEHEPTSAAVRAGPANTPRQQTAIAPGSRCRDSASRRDGATGFVGQRASRSSSPDARLGRGPSVCRRAIGGRAAPASVRSSWDRLTAPIHATERSAPMRPIARARCCFPCKRSSPSGLVGRSVGTSSERPADESRFAMRDAQTRTDEPPGPQPERSRLTRCDSGLYGGLSCSELVSVALNLDPGLDPRRRRVLIIGER